MEKYERASASNARTICLCNAPERLGRRAWTRTRDPQLRRLMLYPPELRARNPEPGFQCSEAPFYNVLNYRRVFHGESVLCG